MCDVMDGRLEHALEGRNGCGECLDGAGSQLRSHCLPRRCLSRGLSRPEEAETREARFHNDAIGLGELNRHDHR